MALRRLAQNNHASPTKTPYASPMSQAGVASVPSTPKNRPRRSSIGSVLRSPAETPSLSSSVAFDWDAARSMKPPPYATPLQNSRARKRASGTPAKRVVRQRGFVERITDIPYQLLLDFPENLPLPPAKPAAVLLGGTLHFLHLCVRVSQISEVADAVLSWEDMYSEYEGSSWFDWTTPMTLLLIAASVFNSYHLINRTKTYTLNARSDPVSSPHATFVRTEVSPRPAPPVSLSTRLWHLFSVCWRWLLNFDPPKARHTRSCDDGPVRRVQQLEVWTPGELEATLFCIYSPAHVLLWMATGSSNWIIMLFIMVLVGLQTHVTIRSYTALIKDKEIISAEVMHEYNAGFVYPRINPIRKDACVMTHQSEVVDVWANDGYY